MTTPALRGRSTVRDLERVAVPAATVVAAVVALGGCGRVAEDAKPSGSRPPATLQVTAVSTDDGVVVSPPTVGAGPVRLVFSNQSSRPVRPTLTNGAGASRGASEAVAPGGVAAIQTTLQRGVWRLRAGSGRPSARLDVTRVRPSSDDALLLP